MTFSAFTYCFCLSSLLASAVSEDQDSIGFDGSTSINVKENIGNVTFCIKFYHFKSEDAVGTVRTTNPNANDPVTSVGNFDYYLELDDENTRKCLNATVLDNSIVEFGIRKTYFLNITLSSFMTGFKYKENKRTLAITITDDDTVSIGFSKTFLTVSESDGNVTVCINRQGEARSPAGGGNVSSGALSVRLSTVQGTAASNDDFTPFDSYLVDFGLNETFKCIKVSIINDNKPEHMETFYITMTNGSSYVTVNETRNNVTVKIMNDDKATAQFKEEYREIEENDENKVIELGCVIEPQSQIPLQISFEIDGFSSTAVDSDFIIYNKSLTFSPGENRVSLQIKIIHDCVAESPEILVLRMISLNEDLVTIGKNNTAKVKIIDKFDHEEAATQKQKQEQEQEKIEKEQRSKVCKLLIAAIVLMTVLIIGGIVVFVYFCIKSKQA